MPRKRLIITIIGLALVGMLAAFGATLRPTAAASPPLQITTTASATSTITRTATLIPTRPVTATVTATATAIVTSTATAIVTTTTTPTATMTTTPSPTPILTTTVTPTPGPITRPFWSFAAKFVCGEQPAEVPGQEMRGEPPVKPGNYATEINIHNPHYRGPIQIRTKVVLLVDRGQPVGRAPGTAAPGSFGPLFRLGDDGATMEDCNSIWAKANPGVALPSPMPLMIGYLVVVSPANLDVVSVLTAANSTSNLEPAGISLETIVVEGKRVLIPSTAFPDRAMPREQEFTDE